MKNNEIEHRGNIIALTNERERRRAIDIALADEHWQQTTASFCAGGLARQSGGLRTGWASDRWAVDGRTGGGSSPVDALPDLKLALF